MAALALDSLLALLDDIADDHGRDGRNAVGPFADAYSCGYREALADAASRLRLAVDLEGDRMADYYGETVDAVEAVAPF